MDAPGCVHFVRDEAGCYGTGLEFGFQWRGARRFRLGIAYFRAPLGPRRPVHRLTNEDVCSSSVTVSEPGVLSSSAVWA